ncbi:MAG TPA: hypothetical protein VK158_01930 [Acidobacteriota bacterium]|nr:hypothetical protein [Acidobacteriota bacterium]
MAKAQEAFGTVGKAILVIILVAVIAFIAINSLGAFRQDLGCEQRGGKCETVASGGTCPYVDGIRGTKINAACYTDGKKDQRICCNSFSDS